MALRMILVRFSLFFCSFIYLNYCVSFESLQITMKKNIFPFILSASIFIAACSANQENKETNEEKSTPVMAYFGDSISTDEAVNADQIPALLNDKDSVHLKVSGTIEEVCQKKGCWMKMNIGQDKAMMVRFKDYGFFVPKDAAGKSLVMEGYAFKDTIPVADLRHYAEDAGKTKEEIEKITEPEIRISFESNGLIIQN